MRVPWAFIQYQNSREAGRTKVTGLNPFECRTFGLRCSIRTLAISRPDEGVQRFHSGSLRLYASLNRMWNARGKNRDTEDAGEPESSAAFGFAHG